MQWVGAAVGLSVLVAVFGSAARREAARPGAGAHQVFVHGAAAAFAAGTLFVIAALAAGALGVRGSLRPPRRVQEPTTPGPATPGTAG